jgi:hypothetical protein
MSRFPPIIITACMLGYAVLQVVVRDRPGGEGWSGEGEGR